jgi:hypothetical protein
LVRLPAGTQLSWSFWGFLRTLQANVAIVTSPRPLPSTLSLIIESYYHPILFVAKWPANLICHRRIHRLSTIYHRSILGHNNRLVVEISNPPTVRRRLRRQWPSDLHNRRWQKLKPSPSLYRACQSIISGWRDQVTRYSPTLVARLPHRGMLRRNRIPILLGNVIASARKSCLTAGAWKRFT